MKESLQQQQAILALQEQVAALQKENAALLERVVILEEAMHGQGFMITPDRVLKGKHLAEEAIEAASKNILAGKLG